MKRYYLGELEESTPGAKTSSFTRKSYNHDESLCRREDGKTREALRSLKEVCEKVNPDFPFHYSFLDQQYESAFESPAKNS